mmetsp:Transcript_13554/g.22158  ORF Transcript_13554/g.22158 Transcript_13554/m.22158 type:complete len:356 (-) Transcript_13554:885-1952(-)
MANTTDPLARSVHGTNPQNLIEMITRSKIYDMNYWKEKCFGVSAEALVDLAMELRAFGGIYGGNNKATDFLCLTLKMLQIQPDKEIIVEFIKNEDYKYVRLLGAFYLRLTGKPLDVYQYLEPLLNDYRKVRHKTPAGKFELEHVDQFIGELLNKDYYCDIALPRLPHRQVLEGAGQLEPRRSALEDHVEQELTAEGEVAAEAAEELLVQAAAKEAAEKDAIVRALPSSEGAGVSIAAATVAMDAEEALVAAGAEDGEVAVGVGGASGDRSVDRRERSDDRWGDRSDRRERDRRDETERRGGDKRRRSRSRSRGEDTRRDGRRRERSRSRGRERSRSRGRERSRSRDRNRSYRNRD